MKLDGSSIAGSARLLSGAELSQLRQEKPSTRLTTGPHPHRILAADHKFFYGVNLEFSVRTDEQLSKLEPVDG
jgi:hypothetical protein